MKLDAITKESDAAEANQTRAGKEHIFSSLNGLTLYKEIFTSTSGAFLLFYAKGKVIDVCVKLEEINVLVSQITNQEKAH